MRFVDTSFWVALLFVRDDHHAEARALWGQRRGALLTTNHILGETWTFRRRRRRHADALHAVEAIRASRSVSLIRVRQDIEDDAWDWLLRHDDREYSFVDASSFAVMNRRRLREALAFDGDFTAAGFIEVRPS